MDWAKFHNIVGGQPRGAKTSRHGTSSLSQQALWEVPVATENDVEECVAAAREAFPAWSRKTYEQRTQLLDRFADLYLSHAAEFSQLLADECGRTVENAAVEVYWAAQWLRYPSKYTIPQQRIEDESKVVVTTYEPLGLVAAICPWNFPLMLDDLLDGTITSGTAIGKIAPALATGNCVILKPSPFTPYTSLKLVELAQQVFPPSVLQVLSGDDGLGPLLVQHPGIVKISFTGSSATGRRILKAGADQMKRITLETAGNNAAIILPDIDVETTASRVAGALWFNAGQVCIATRRLYIHRDVFDDFVEKLACVTADSNRDLAARIGPVQNRVQAEKLIETLRHAASVGGHDFVSGGPETLSSTGGLFLKPTICKNPPPDSPLLQQENFGPIVCCVTFSTTEQAVRLANDTEGGLAASVWSGDQEAARRIASQLEAGSVFINGPPRPDPCVPFAGHKQSGLGSEYGLEGLLSFCQVKSVYTYA